MVPYGFDSDYDCVLSDFPDVVWKIVAVMIDFYGADETW